MFLNIATKYRQRRHSPALARVGISTRDMNAVRWRLLVLRIGWYRYSYSLLRPGTPDVD